MKSGANLRKSFSRIFEYKIAYDGGFKNFALYFCEKIFSILKVGFERNLNRILKIVKIVFLNIKDVSGGGIKCVTPKFFDSIFLYKSMLYLHTGIDQARISVIL